MGILSSIFGGGKPDEKQTDKQEEKNFEILKYDGIRARNIGQLDYAIRCFENAVALNAEPETLGLLANACLRAGRIDDARAALVRLTEKDAGNVNALLALADVCHMQEDYAAMDEACRKALALDETNATACYQAARAARGLHNDLQAIVMLTKAIAQNEQYADAYLLRAETLWDMRQIKDAREDADKVLQLDPENEEALLLEGRIAAAQGDASAACECFDRVTSLDPFCEEAYLLKGELLLLQKEFDRVADNYTEALELMPGNARLYQERGRARLLKDDKEGAAEDMKRAIELNPESESLITGNFKNYEANKR